MKLFLAALALCASISCFARVGESLRQCFDRYGQAIDGSVPVDYPIDPGAKITYEKNGMLTTCTFDNPVESISKPSDIKTIGSGFGSTTSKKERDYGVTKLQPSVCVKINFKEKGSKDNAQIEASIPELLKANAGVLKWNEVEKGARWECVNKKLVATFSKSSGLTITDISSNLFKDQAAKAAEAAPEAKAKTLKGF